MKRLASALVEIALFLTVGAATGWAQRSGSLQATAQVVDTRAAVSGLEKAQSLAASWSITTPRSMVDTRGIAQVSLISYARVSQRGRAERELAIRVDYLRN